MRQGVSCQASALQPPRCPPPGPHPVCATQPLVLQDSGTSRVLMLPFLEPLAGTLDGWLLDQW